MGEMRRPNMQRSVCLVAAIAGLAALLGLSATARAEEPAAPSTQQVKPMVCPICGRVSDPSATYSTKAGSTLVRGAANAAFGWTELISEPVHEVKHGGNVLVGIGKGVGRTLTRTLSGLAEVLTFWTPKVNNRYIEFSTDCPICMKQSQQPPR